MMTYLIPFVSIAKLRKNYPALREELSSFDKFMDVTGGHKWSAGDTNGFPFAKYLMAPGSDLCSWTATPTLAEAAKGIATHFWCFMGAEQG